MGEELSGAPPTRLAVARAERRRRLRDRALAALALALGPPVDAQRLIDVPGTTPIDRSRHGLRGGDREAIVVFAEARRAQARS
jgi:hypothetical protein